MHDNDECARNFNEDLWLPSYVARIASKNWNFPRVHELPSVNATYSRGARDKTPHRDSLHLPSNCEVGWAIDPVWVLNQHQLPHRYMRTKVHKDDWLYGGNSTNSVIILFSQGFQRTRSCRLAPQLRLGLRKTTFRSVAKVNFSHLFYSF